MIDNRYLSIKINKDSSFPAANQLAKQLTWMIAEGLIQQGEILPSIREFADILGIHMHTVRAAYHQLEERGLVVIRPKIGTVVQEYIPFVTINEQDYLNRELVGVLVPELSDFYNELVAGIERKAAQIGLIPVVLACHNDPVYAEAVYKNLSAKNFAGIINISLGFSDDFYKDFQRKTNLNIPLIFLDDFNARTHRIMIDTSSAISMATDHIIDHGYKKLALVNCPEEWPVGKEILKGFHELLSRRNIDPGNVSVYTVPDFSFEAGVFCAERILQEKAQPRAIVTASDTLALGLISAFKERKIQIPEDIAIIGYNNIFPASIADPPLTTVALPLYQMGDQSMQLLDEVRKNKANDWVNKVFSGKLVIRSSCGCNR